MLWWTLGYMCLFQFWLPRCDISYTSFCPCIFFILDNNLNVYMSFYSWFTLLYLAVLCFFYRLKVCGQACFKLVYRHHFSNSICSVSVSGAPFGNSHCIIIIFVMVICDQWSLMLLLQKDYDSMKPQIMDSTFQQYSIFKLNHVYLFRQNTTVHLKDHSVMKT